MKFHDLEIGQRFELDGVTYVKTSPVMAGQADGGGSKFMPRYAMVKLLDAVAPRARVEQEKMLRAGEVLAAFEAFYAACRGELDKLVGEVSAERLTSLSGAIEEQRKVFLDTFQKR